MKTLLLVIFTFAVTLDAQAQLRSPDSLFIFGTSIHFKDGGNGENMKHKGGDTNEFNYGLGVQWRLEDADSLSIGAYRNSYYKDSQFVLYGFNLWDTKRGIYTYRLEFLAGGITGYGDHPKDISFYAAPMFTVKRNRLGLSTIWVPGTVVAFGLTYDLN